MDCCGQTGNRGAEETLCPAQRRFGYSGLMTSFHEFLTQLFLEGRVVFRSAKGAARPAAAEDIALLEKAYRSAPALGRRHADIPFDPAVGYSAAELIRQASWAIVNHDDRVSHLKKRLTMPIEPSDARASPFGRSDAAVPATDSQPGARARSDATRSSSFWKTCSGDGRFSGVLSDVAAAPLELARFRRAHRACCCFMPSGLRQTTAQAWRPAQPRPGLGVL